MRHRTIYAMRVDVRPAAAPRLKLAVTIARGFSTNTLPLLQLRVPFRKMRDEPRLALGFRTNFQEPLADGYIDRQFGRHVVGERNTSLGFKARRVFPVKNLVALVAELLEPGGNRGIDRREIL